MGAVDVVYGAILEPWQSWAPNTASEFRERNEATLNSLPLDPCQGLVSRSLFSLPDRDSCAEYHGRVIHFGGSFHALDIGQWNREFSALISRLFWHSAFVHIKPDWMLATVSTWSIHDQGSTDCTKYIEEILRNGAALAPPTCWRVEGGEGAVEGLAEDACEHTLAVEWSGDRYLPTNS